jgi:hypothetical protein
MTHFLIFVVLSKFFITFEPSHWISIVEEAYWGAFIDDLHFALVFSEVIKCWCFVKVVLHVLLAIFSVKLHMTITKNVEK